MEGRRKDGRKDGRKDRRAYLESRETPAACSESTNDMG